MSWWPYVACLLSIFIAGKFLEYRTNSRKLSNLRGLRSIFSPASPFGTLIPTCSWNPGLGWQWQWRNQVYSKYGLQTMSVMAYLSGRPAIYTISMDVARQILSVKGQFKKPELTTLLMKLWGPNIFTENGAEWSRHRRIMNPAFTPETNAFVWDEAANLYQQMIENEGWVHQDDLKIPAINGVTSKFALILIARCGFGQSISWETKSPGSGMLFGEALLIVSRSSIVRLITPRWMYKLPIQRLHQIESAYSSLGILMKELISTRREELALEEEDSAHKQKDVFRLLLRASQGQGKLQMSDDELVGNTFLMLFAGHETTARALDAAIGFLALYEDIQEEVFQEIRSVMSLDGKLAFEHYSRLTKVQSAFLEASRLFPAVMMIFRETTDIVTLKTDEEDGHGGQVTLGPGTWVAVDVPGIHYSPRYFPAPEDFRPSRWYGVSESDMTMFSLGPRSCVAFLSNLLCDWKLQIVLKPGETRPQWRARVMRGASAMTLGVGEVPVRLTRR
ncbi:cytochrome P450 [Mycena alexandri]|uniref:Cytochrome P450 n=1 Tax=Mycena alexandri TaxID=1745969 RepID=A0AAD6X1T0_9AGAR|nr:cytochrome P450 [Mycena alexandri]